MKTKKGENSDDREILKKILVLPLLPPEKIQQGLDLIKTLAEEKFANDGNKLTKWRKFLLYINNEWMKKVKPQVFCVFNEVDPY